MDVIILYGISSSQRDEDFKIPGRRASGQYEVSNAIREIL
jgi:hypothetical protein